MYLSRSSMGLHMTLSSKLDKNSCQISQSKQHSSSIFMLWKGFNIPLLPFLVLVNFAYMHLIKTLPGWMALIKKLRYPMSTCNCFNVALFLGGLSLHLNHLIGSCMTNYDWPFGTLPFGLFGSNLDTRDLETYPRTYSGHF